MASQSIPPLSQGVTANVAAIAGPPLVGYSMHCVLFGALCIQVYLYYLSFPRDTALAKCLVSLLLAVDMVQFALLTHNAIGIYVKGFMTFTALDDVQLSWLSIPVLSGLLSCGVQVFFVYRIWLLSRSRIACAAPLLLSILQCGAAIATGALALKAGVFSKVGHSTFIATTVWLVGSAVCDAIIAFTMGYYYLQRNSVDKISNALLAFIVSMALETGALIATVALVELVLFLRFPGKVYYSAPLQCLAMLYSNACMAVLNSRISIAGGREEPDAAVLTFSSSGVARPTADGRMKRFVDVGPAAPVPPEKEMWGEGIQMTPIDSKSYMGRRKPK